MSLWFWVCACAVACVAGAFDARTGRIPNSLTLPSLVAALAWQAWVGGVAGLGHALLAVLLVGLPCLWLFVRRALGGGDLKLLAALAAALGPGAGLRVELLSFVLVSAYVVCAAVWHGRAWALGRASGVATLHLFAPSRYTRPAPVAGLQTQIRLGPFIAVACALVVLEAWP